MYKESDAAGVSLSDWCAKQRESSCSPLSPSRQAERDTAEDCAAPPPVHLLLSDDEDARNADDQPEEEVTSVGVSNLQSHGDPTESVGADAPPDNACERAQPPDGLSKSELKSWEKEREKAEKQQKKLLAQEEKERKREEAAKAKAEKKKKGKAKQGQEQEPEPEPEQQQEPDQEEQVAIDSGEPAVASASTSSLAPNDLAPGASAADDPLIDVENAAPAGGDLTEEKLSKKAQEKAEKE